MIKGGMSNTRIEEERRIITALLKHREARIFLGLLLEESGFLQGSISEDAISTAFREGERNIGMRVFQMIHRVSEKQPLSCMREFGAWLDFVTRLHEQLQRKEEEA